MRKAAKLALVALAIVVAVETWTRVRASRGAGPGAAAPDFTLPDAQGRPVTLSQLRGRVVAVNFWASWCGPCKAEIPELAALYSASSGKCVEILGVAEGSGPREEVVSAARALGINYPVLVDSAEGAVADQFRVVAFPRTVVVDAHGTVRKVFDGAIDRPTLEQALAPLLAETKGSCPRAL